MFDDEIAARQTAKEELDEVVEASLGDPNATAADLLDVLAALRILKTDAEALLETKSALVTIH
jgi:hypothetical protein